VKLAVQLGFEATQPHGFPLDIPATNVENLPRCRYSGRIKLRHFAEVPTSWSATSLMLNTQVVRQEAY
jgi:hypothetical protein